MDVLEIILRTVRASIECTGVPPDRLQDALRSAEDSLRGALGGERHHISRLSRDQMLEASAKARIAELLAKGRTVPQIAEAVGVSARHVRRVQAMLRVD